MWPFRRKERKIKVPKESESEILELLRRYIRSDIAGGFRPIGIIQELAIETVADEFDEAHVRSVAPTVMNEELAAYRNSRHSWSDVTDCDRLDAAFSELADSGIVALQNGVCCQTCAADEAWAEAASKIDDGQQIRGVTFYHQQDTERAVEGQGIYLSYGATETSEDAALAIGEEVRQVLLKHGLNVTWDGNLNKRLHVKLDWKRRRSDIPA